MIGPRLYLAEVYGQVTGDSEAIHSGDLVESKGNTFDSIVR